MVRDTRVELVSSVWKTDILADIRIPLTDVSISLYYNTLVNIYQIPLAKANGFVASLQPSAGTHQNMPLAYSGAGLNYGIHSVVCRAKANQVRVT